MHFQMTHFQQLLKFVFTGSLTFICLSIISVVAFSLLPIEFTDSKTYDSFEEIYLFGLPIATMLTLAGTVKKTDSVGFKISKFFITFCVTGLLIFILIIFAFASHMCAWTVNSILFEKKIDTSVKIIDRSYDCGAWDSSDASGKIFKVRKLTNYFIWATEIDTVGIDRNVWIAL